LQILEQEQLIYTERTNGKYVTLNLEIIERLRKETLGTKIKDLISELKRHKYSNEEIRECIEKELRTDDCK